MNRPDSDEPPQATTRPAETGARPPRDSEGRRPWTPDPADVAAAEAGGPPLHQPGADDVERAAEVGLRPARFADFVGQRHVLEVLEVTLRAADDRNEAPDHVLLCGPPGLGKTTLARIVSSELGSQLHSTSGPSLERPRDLVGILTNLSAGDVLFIDEVHRVPASVEEYLYTAMEDRSIDFTFNEGPAARAISLSLEPFTLIGATTREGLLTAPFRARFGLSVRLTPYSDEELIAILQRSAGLLGVDLDPAAAAVLATRARGTPRVANRFLRRVRDRAQLQSRGSRPRIDAGLAEEGMASLGIDEHGLDEMDRRILAHLAREPDRAVGLKTLAAAVSESEDTIEDVFEPHLLRMGFLHKTARGRQVTAAGIEVLGGTPPAGQLFE